MAGRFSAYLCLSVVTLIVFGVISVPVYSQTLPMQTGAINDYAAVLGGKPQREPLHQLIEQIETQFGVPTIVLVSERNPFQTIEQYGAEIRRAWGLANPNSIFALYVKQDFQWSFDLWLGASVQFDVESGGLNRLVNQVQTQTKRGRVPSAVMLTLEGLQELLEAGNTQSDSTANGIDLGWWMGMIGLPGIALLGTLRWLRSYCPRCVKRLSRSRSSARPYCSSCGYRR